MKRNQKTLRLQDSQFDYDEYVRNETELNKIKFNYTSFSYDELACIVKNFKTKFIRRDWQTFALCQGVRNGTETHLFTKNLGFRVIGTDISDTILNVENGVMVDFHDCPKIWFGKVDFLYSNSWDQSYDVGTCIIHWARLLSETGVIYLQHTPNHFKDTGISVAGLSHVMASAGIECEETITLSQPTAVVVFFRRINKLLARFQGKSLPMSKSMRDTFILVGRKRTNSNATRA